jgi:hypothetical protein
MRQEPARGVQVGFVDEVRLQQRNRDCPVDDVVVLAGEGTEQVRLYIQVKHEIVFGDNGLFLEVVKQAWQQMHSPDFKLGRDRIALAIGEVCNNRTVRYDCQRDPSEEPEDRLRNPEGGR